jgi:hypothetical protein
MPERTVQWFQLFFMTLAVLPFRATVEVKAPRPS